MKLILGSQSKGRSQVLRNAGYSFSVLVPSINEKAIRSDNFKDMTLLIAQAKAQALLPQISEPALLITADHVMVWNGELREKPQSIDEAKKFLETYSNNSALSISSVVVTNTETHKQEFGTDMSKVFFKEIPTDVITEILQEEDTLSMSGALNIDDVRIAPYIDRIEGDRDSVIGLPMKLLNKLFSEFVLVQPPSIIRACPVI